MNSHHTHTHQHLESPCRENRIRIPVLSAGERGCLFVFGARGCIFVFSKYASPFSRQGRILRIRLPVLSAEYENGDAYWYSEPCRILPNTERQCVFGYERSYSHCRSVFGSNTIFGRMNHVTYMTESCHAQVTLGFRRREGRETTYCKQIQKFWNKQKLKQISDIRQVEKHVTFYMGREPNYFNTLPLRMSGFSNTKSIFLCDKNESQKFWNEFL